MTQQMATVGSGPPSARLETSAPAAAAMPARPTWRGRLHFFALFGAVPALLTLVILASGAKARMAVIVYALGLCSMFAVSTTYHRWTHTPRSRAAWKRADHGTIYAAIAGTFTPVCLLAVPGWGGVVLLAIIWTGAVIGATMKFVDWRHANLVGAILYIALGWAGLFALPAMWQGQGVWPAVLLLSGGLLYTLGAIGFARSWPTLRPATFSYHEIWHAFTIAAASAQLVAVWLIAT